MQCSGCRGRGGDTGGGGQGEVFWGDCGTEFDSEHGEEEKAEGRLQWRGGAGTHCRPGAQGPGQVREEKGGRPVGGLSVLMYACMLLSASIFV